MAEKIILLGCGRHAKSVVDSIEAGSRYEIAGFINKEPSSFKYRAYKVIGCDKDLEKIFALGIKNAFICVGFMGKNLIRNNLAKKLYKIGFNLPTIADPSAVIALDAQIKRGAFIGKRAVVNSASVIGENAIINTASVIEHDCQIGDFSHIAAASILCGNVKVGNNCLIGANACILQNLCIGDNSIIGAASLILKDIGANTTVYNKRNLTCSTFQG